MKIFFAGDCGIDNYTDLEIIQPGGISLNMAVHAKKLFSSNDTVGVISVIGNDSAAETVKKTCKKYNLQAHLQQIKGSTPVQYIKNTKDGEKIFTRYDAGVLDGYKAHLDQLNLLADADLLVSPLYSQVEPFFKSIIINKIKGLKAADFGSLEDYGKSDEAVKKYISHLDIAFLGLNTNDSKLISNLKRLSLENDTLMVITLGNEGSIAFDNGTEFRAKPLKVKKVVDTTGAGDAFTAAFLSEYVVSKNIQASLSKGNAYASQIIQHIGGFTI